MDIVLITNSCYTYKMKKIQSMGEIGGRSFQKDMKTSYKHFVLIFILQFLLLVSIAKCSAKKTTKQAIPPEKFLSSSYYDRTCPNAQAIIQTKMQEWISKDPTLAASIIRLHFHDCAVRGCDGSILLNKTGSERTAIASRTLRGFQVIDDIKAAIEKSCPRTVSCADILTAAARDATLLAGGPFWEVPFGRKDGLVSFAKEADAIVPQGRENLTTLLQFFGDLGLNILDLVVLSGVHTIGRCTCGAVQYRFGNFNGTTKPDPSIDVTYLNSLKKQCKRAGNFVNLDVTTPTTFDVAYYTNLESKKGLLSTDQLLYSNPTTSSFVSALAAQPSLFESQFAASMVKLGNVQVKTGQVPGEIRRDCNIAN